MMENIRFLLLGVAVLGVAWWASRRTAAQADTYEPNTDSGDWYTVPEPSELVARLTEPDQTTSLIEDAVIAATPSTYRPAVVDEGQAAVNVGAFLSMIAYAEGTAGPDGYRTLFGGGKFDSYADHPRIYVPFRTTSSSAAGRYQILARTWDTLARRLGLTDFGPDNQDAAAIELIRERGALNDARAGRTAAAVDKVRKVWASLPGAGYAQPERSINQLLAAYERAGGTFEGQA
jgi:muramidase (phage lysozyme)